MKKASFVLALLILLLMLCSGSAQYAAAEAVNKPDDLPRITLLIEPDWSQRISDLNDLELLYVSEYDWGGTVQQALDEITLRYNVTHDNHDLMKLCLVIRREGFDLNLKNGDIVEAAYFYRFFNLLWAGVQIKDADSIKDEFAMLYTRALYHMGKQEQCLIFIDQYSAHLRNINDKISFTTQRYYDLFLIDPDVDKNYVQQIFSKLKEFERDDYNQIYDLLKVGLLGAISKTADLLGDKQTSEEYKTKGLNVIKEYS